MNIAHHERGTRSKSRWRFAVDLLLLFLLFAAVAGIIVTRFIGRQHEELVRLRNAALRRQSEVMKLRELEKAQSELGSTTRPMNTLLPVQITPSLSPL